LLDRYADEISVVATDIEMPRLDGLSLTRKIRADARFGKLPVIALSSLAAEEEIARGLEAGISEYQVKLDRDRLLESIDRVTGRNAGAPERSDY
jgi:two-component system chemotaxis sensor kinase CheA